MKIKIALILLMTFRICCSLNAQVDTNRFELQIEFAPESQKIVDQRIQGIKVNLIKKLDKEKIKYDESSLNSMAKTEYLYSITLGEYYRMLTPESQKWLSEFFNNYTPDSIVDFKTFYEEYKDQSFKEIRKYYERIDRLKTKSKKATRTRSFIPPLQSDPDISEIDGSMMIRDHTFDGQKRYLITTPKQSIYLRGSYTNDFPYFPDYKNIYCDDCCGPAAGQSILEWFNVPVKKPNGTVLTTSSDIQKRLANLMDTEDGIDYTHPDKLRNTLIRDEFLGYKGYCYTGYNGNGSFNQLHYMLSNGTPVILLIAKDNWAHYVTVYGYDVEDDKYFLANKSDQSKASLKDLWYFNNTSVAADAAYWTTNTNSKTLFSYNNDGCSTPWDYDLHHNDVLAFDVTSRDELYYEKFYEDYVKYNNENGMKLNLYGYYTWTIMGFYARTRVNDDSRNIYLNSGNTHIISYRYPYYNEIGNNSINQNLNIEVKVDKRFLDRYDLLYCGFKAKDEDDNVIYDGYKKYQYTIDVTASNNDPNNYVFKFNEPYQTNYKKVDFLIHGGFRKVSWDLAGCVLDNDLDGICDEVDPDDDDDGVLDVDDNCPIVYNPSQEDNDGNGEGLECDFKEQCLLDCDPDYFTDLSTTSSCAYGCGEKFEVVIFEESWLKVIHSKWWTILMDNPFDPEDPRFIRSKEFKGLYQDFKLAFDKTGLIQNDRQGRKILLEIVSNSCKSKQF